MVYSNLRRILFAVGTLLIIVGVGAISKAESVALMDKRGDSNTIKLSYKKDNLVEYLLTENNKEHFSFIQEDAVKIGASYVNLLEQISKESSVPATRMLINEGNNTSSSVKPMTDEEMQASALRQIMVWLPIGLALVLYFVIMSLVDMSVQKNSILYAKYGTTKQLQGPQ